ncbi:MAG TPA: NAD(P)-dependent oxidoreductase [Longimicrobiales bacterium]|nr:NAD(P)-dependent oxidoreductase [Longimicrobiales bacterium]
MKILLTGATGVIGRRVVPLLTAAGHEVHAVARSPRKAAALEAAGAHPVEVDLFDAAGVRRAVVGTDAVINLATHIPSSTWRMMLRSAWRENDRLRREASAILAGAAREAGVGRFVQESFAPIYEDQGDRWIDETAPVRPVAYNATVLDAERSAERFTAGGGTGVVLRFAAFYGPDAFTTRDMAASVRRGWSPLPGAPGAYLSSVTHDDAASAVVAALGAGAGTYNVVEDEPVTRREWADVLARTLGVAPPKLLPAWTVRLMGSTGELLSRSLRISNRKLRQATGWVPRYPSVREGWPATVAEMG